MPNKYTFPISVLAGFGLVAVLVTGCAPSNLDVASNDMVRATAVPQVKRTPDAPPTPVVTVSEVTTTEPMPFGQLQANDPGRDVGNNAITTAGIAGVQTNTWQVTITDGAETDRTLVRQEVTVAPVDEVTSIGTRRPPPPPPVAAPSGCDPNYGGQCVPVASDVDCAGGSGNGPAYVNGVVTVIGSDVYDLDRDGDGIGCD